MMEHIEDVNKSYLQQWSQMLSSHIPHSLSMLTWVHHDLCFDSFDSADWFYDDSSKSLCSIRNLHSKRKNQSTFIGFFCLKVEDVEELLQFLLKILDFERNILFSAVEKQHWQSVINLLEKIDKSKMKDAVITKDICHKFFDQSQYPLGSNSKLGCKILQNLQNLLKPLPINAEVKVVQDLEGDAEIIASNWKFCNDFTLGQVQKQIQRGLAYGVFVEDKIVAWVNIDENGFVSKMFTLPSHRGQGLAMHVLRSILIRGTETRIPVLIFVEEDNDASFKLFSKTGFDIDENKVAFILFKTLTEGRSKC